MDQDKPPIVDIYCRTATVQQDEHSSLDEQEAACRAYCTEHGLSVGMVHHEVSSGSTYGERERLGLMRARYRARSIQGVAVQFLDRLSRSHTHLVILIGEMKEHGVTLYCVNGGLDNTPQGRVVQLILDFIAEMEREMALNVLPDEPEH